MSRTEQDLELQRELADKTDLSPLAIGLICFVSSSGTPKDVPDVLVDARHDHYFPIEVTNGQVMNMLLHLLDVGWLQHDGARRLIPNPRLREMLDVHLSPSK